MKYFIVLCLCTNSLFLYGQSTIENQMISAIDKRTPKAIALLKEVVNINSGTMNFKGVKKVGEIFMEQLKVIGFETRWIDGKEFNRAGHLSAIHKAAKGPRFLLIGHLDTVFDEKSPFQTYKMLNDSILQGPGASDMKGGDVIIILAMQALADADLLKDLNIEIIMSGDEESSGYPLSLSKKELIAAGKRADIALGYEDGDGLSTTAVVNRRGSSDWTLNVQGNAAHSSQIFTKEVGVGAIYELSRILNDFYLSLSKEEDLSISPGLIVGGDRLTYDSSQCSGNAIGKNNIVSQSAIAKGDLRTISITQLNKAKKIMKEIVKNNYPQTMATISFGENAYPPMSRNEGNIKLLNYYDQVSLNLGFGPITEVNPRKAGAADISFVNEFMLMALDGIGLSGNGGHTENETANLNYLSIEAKRTAILMYRIMNGQYKY
ncbi:MAG: M20/M25/M40 family metallo-hydrolase [Saprospiraceae bacterium]